MFANTVDFRLSLDFFDSGLYTRTAVARLTLALAKLSCIVCSTTMRMHDRDPSIGHHTDVSQRDSATIHRQAHNAHTS